MGAERARCGWAGLKRLLFAFGIYGLVVWPAAAWLAYDLVSSEIKGLDSLHVNASTLIGRDFVNVWHGGGEALKSGADSVYDRSEYRRTLDEAVGARGIYAYSYPPHMLLLSIPFGLLSYVPALLLWSLGGLILFWHAARPWLRDAGLPGWSVLVLPGTVINLWAGHFGFLIGALALYGWRAVGRDKRLAGLSFALMSVKPHMGVLVPVVLALKRDWMTMFWGALGVIILAALSALALGPSAWMTWIGSTLVFQANLIEAAPGREFIFMMPTVGRMIQAISDDFALLAFGQLLAAVYALAILVWANRRGAALSDLGLLSLAATPVILPYAFHYDLVALTLFALVWAVRWPLRWYAPDRLVYGAVFLVPLAQTPLAHEGIWVSPLALMALLGLVGWRMAREAGGKAQ